MVSSSSIRSHRSSRHRESAHAEAVHLEPPEPVIVLAVPSGPRRDQMQRAIGSRYRLELCDGPGQIVRCMARGDVGAVVVRLDDVAEHSAGPALAQLRRRFPTLPIIAHAPPAEPRAVGRLATLGYSVSALIAVEQISVLSEAVTSALRASPPQGPQWPLVSAVEGRIGDDIYPFVRLCILNPGPTALLELLIDACGVARRTLEARLVRHGCRTPRDILAESTVTAGMWFYDTGRMTLDAVATRLGLDSGARLSTMCRRQFELTPTELRALGGFRFVFPLFTWQFRVLPSRELLAA